MKKIFVYVVLGLASSYGYAQNNNNNIPIKDLTVPASPAFNLLDVSPKTIERPATVKALALGIVNTFDQDGGIPKNFSMEFAPFWLFKHPNMSFFKYNGLMLYQSDSFRYKPNIFYGLRNFSIAIASVAKDSSKKFPLDVNYISYSIKANILNIRKRRVLDSLKKAGENLNDIIAKNLASDTMCDRLFNQVTQVQEYNKCVNDNLYRKNVSIINSKRNYIDTILTIRPVFTLDAAFASSTAFGNNNFSNNHAYRTGGWITFCYSQPLLDSSLRRNLSGLYNADNYINIYGFFRILNEDSTTNFKTFTKRSYIDYGGRLEFEFDRFAVSFESVHRNVRNRSDLNSFRNVGILQYRISDNLFLTGTFGKNFGSQDNLVAFLGINFGFGKTALYNEFQ